MKVAFYAAFAERCSLSEQVLLCRTATVNCEEANATAGRGSSNARGKGKTRAQGQGRGQEQSVLYIRR